MPSAPHLTVFLKQRTRRVEGLRRAPCQLKKPFDGPRQRPGSCWEERKRTIYPLQKGNRKNGVSGHRPGGVGFDRQMALSASRQMKRVESEAVVLVGHDGTEERKQVS